MAIQPSKTKTSERVKTIFDPVTQENILVKMPATGPSSFTRLFTKTRITQEKRIKDIEANVKAEALKKAKREELRVRLFSRQGSAGTIFAGALGGLPQTAGRPTLLGQI